MSRIGSLPQINYQENVWTFFWAILAQSSFIPLRMVTVNRFLLKQFTFKHRKKRLDRENIRLFKSPSPVVNTINFNTFSNFILKMFSFFLRNPKNVEIWFLSFEKITPPLQVSMHLMSTIDPILLIVLYFWRDIVNNLGET